MLNNLSPAFKTYLTIINNQIQNVEKLEENNILFKTIDKKETYIKAKHKAFINFALIKSNAKHKKRASKKKVC